MVWLPDDGLLHIPERFIRNEANRRGWHHGWLDEEGHQREDLIVIPRDQQPELERMFRALVLCFPL
ncbi:hypothetical protein PHYSODRAFT_354041 [Phytophthora sojae]|uniref:Uncharacterized protein n=1 Tax=Phytophthora sojae (strain P6497) TaxID=1094619 RepID=G4YXS0_PHYSP|nr:hypothetical protein PHYSODRAFT_354041 [Phytophthora sojae]EGZ25063.1 hypothetical protein PHYSODRAFT_354041 [Phytophthora sojae]|eukprot:XP_009520351.1 hypothetical protein PHYSODRAFT_354041 [Phytophthora sojae]